MNKTLVAHREHVQSCGRSFPTCKSGGGDVQSPKFDLGTSDTQAEEVTRYILNETPTASSIPSIRYSPSNKIRVHANNSSSGSLWGSNSHNSKDLMSRNLVSVERSVGMLIRNKTKL